MNINELREAMTNHRVDDWQLFKMLVDIVEGQNRRIDELSAAISNQHERHDNQIAALRRDVERLKGVHGA